MRDRRPRPDPGRAAPASCSVTRSSSSSSPRASTSRTSPTWVDRRTWRNRSRCGGRRASVSAINCTRTERLEIDHREEWHKVHETVPRQPRPALQARPLAQDPRRLGPRRRHRQTTDGPTRRPAPPEEQTEAGSRGSRVIDGSGSGGQFHGRAATWAMQGRAQHRSRGYVRPTPARRHRGCSTRERAQVGLVEPALRARSAHRAMPVVPLNREGQRRVHPARIPMGHDMRRPERQDRRQYRGGTASGERTPPGRGREPTVRRARGSRARRGSASLPSASAR